MALLEIIGLHFRFSWSFFGELLTRGASEKKYKMDAPLAYLRM